MKKLLHATWKTLSQKKSVARLIWQKFKPLCRGAKNLLYPPECLLCQEALVDQAFKVFCKTCYLNFDQIEPEGRCSRCFELSCDPEGRCHKKGHFCRKILAVYDYEANAEVLIGALKGGGQSHLAEGMGALMTLYWLEQGHALPDIIIPVPSSPLNTFKRGFSSSFLLAKTIGNLMNRPVWDGLAKELSFLKQSELSKAERLSISLEAIILTKDPYVLKDKHILLVDDVMTTGQTLYLSSSHLLEGYPAFIDALVFAR